jgi:hypothetical protein
LLSTLWQKSESLTDNQPGLYGAAFSSMKLNENGQRLKLTPETTAQQVAFTTRGNVVWFLEQIQHSSQEIAAVILQ